MGRPEAPLIPAGSLKGTERQIYEQVFDNALVGICFMQDRRFVRVNSRMEEMLGYAPGELDGQSVRVVYARQQDYDEVGRIVEHFPQANRYVHERALVARDGSLLWCLIAGKQIDPQDPATSSVWVVQDLSAKKRAEDALARTNQRLEATIAQRTLNQQKTNAALKLEVERRRASERAMIESREKYRVLIRNVPLGIVITDASGRFVEINPAMQAFFRSPGLERFSQEAERTHCSVLGESEPVSLSALIRRCSPGVPHPSEHLTVSVERDGKLTWFDVVGVRVPVSDLGSAVVFLDRTEQRRARAREQSQQQQLAHASRLSMMGQFASALAHELGQPLNACLSYAAGIEHRLGPELGERPEAREALERIQLHLAQAGNVIRNVRAFVARHRPGDESIDLERLVADTLELLQLQLRESSTQVQLQIESGLPPLHGTRVELQQVLVNLIVNAIEAMRPSVPAPRVLIAIRRRANGVELAVSDNGPGIAETLRGKLFEPYHTTKPGGLGMGLMMCRTIIESHGGNLDLDTGFRGGARFVFRLPLAEENP